MSDSLGARLRQRREQQDIALLTIAEQTKIKLSLLESLERDDVSHWPGGIFRRAFIRTYAHAIGLDPDVVVREFLEIYPDPVEVAEPAAALAAGADQTRVSAGPPTRLRHIVGSALESLARLRRAATAAADLPPESAPVTSPVELASRAPVDAAVRVDASSAVAAAMPRLEPAVSATRVGPEMSRTKRTDAPPPAIVEVRAEPAEAIEVPVACQPPSAAAAPVPDFLAAADLCTEFGRVENATEVQPLLQKAAAILDAIGLIVWVWDPQPAVLKPAMACGYSDKVLAQLPTVKRDGDNVTAAAFRSAQTCAIDGSDQASGALVVPLLTPAGCAGVLAIELQHGVEQTKSVRALATIFAAQLAQLTGAAGLPTVRPEPPPIPPVTGNFPTPVAPRAGRGGSRQRLTERVGRLNA
jgi:transcriptional regulator with XRE-family HTH domain